jgi:hypothetical protein
MAETINVGEIAGRISKEIFQHFFWQKSNKHDENFPCVNNKHLTDGQKQKVSHPGDAVFFYDDPYLSKKIYLHTDLKSYKKETIKVSKLRDALKSLCVTVECANESEDWRKKYSVDDYESHEVRGLLFVHNYDNGYESQFYELINKIDLQGLPLSSGLIVHYLGPHDINRLYSIGNDIIRLIHSGEIGRNYTFYYPDLVMYRRQGDVWNQAATIESLTGPYLFIKHAAVDASNGSGYVIYYNRPGSTPEEFEYFIDCLSRYQMLESTDKIRSRGTDGDAIDDLKSMFHLAKKKYCRAWGFDPAREAILDEIEIERVTSVTSTYNPGDMGWRNEK